MVVGAGGNSEGGVGGSSWSHRDLAGTLSSFPHASVTGPIGPARRLAIAAITRLLACFTLFRGYPIFQAHLIALAGTGPTGAGAALLLSSSLLSPSLHSSRRQRRSSVGHLVASVTQPHPGQRPGAGTGTGTGTGAGTGAGGGAPETFVFQDQNLLLGQVVQLHDAVWDLFTSIFDQLRGKGQVHGLSQRALALMNQMIVELAALAPRSVEKIARLGTERLFSPPSPLDAGLLHQHTLVIAKAFRACPAAAGGTGTDRVGGVGGIHVGTATPATAGGPPGGGRAAAAVLATGGTGPLENLIKYASDHVIGDVLQWDDGCTC